MAVVRVGSASPDYFEDLTVAQGAEVKEGQDDADEEGKVADAVDEERFRGGDIGAVPVVPKANEEVGAQPHHFPEDEKLEQVVRHDQHDHAEDEERNPGVESRFRRIVVHVADGVERHQRADAGNHQQHDNGERIEQESDIDG